MDTTIDSRTFSSAPVGARSRWAGRVLTAVPVFFLTFDGAIKLAGHPAVTEASIRMGLPASLSPGLGILLLACVVTYVVPRTAVAGAVLLTGYLGGAVMTHLRIGDPWLSHTLFPIYVGAMLWAGLLLRDRRARDLMAGASTSEPREDPRA